MKKERFCPISGKSLTGFHGNRKLHPDAIRSRKKESNSRRYDKIKEMDKKALNLDRMLKHYYPVSKGKDGIDKNLLIGFAWDFITRITNSTTLIFWILDYGYSYIDNKRKIIIHHGAIL